METASFFSLLFFGVNCSLTEFLDCSFHEMTFPSEGKNSSRRRVTRFRSVAEWFPSISLVALTSTRLRIGLSIFNSFNRQEESLIELITQVSHYTRKVVICVIMKQIIGEKVSCVYVT